MTTRRSTFLLFIFSFLLLPAFSAYAAGVSDYDQKALAKAKAEGKTVLLQFHAKWCPTCSRQRSTLDTVLAEPAYAQVVALAADYDESETLQKELDVHRQSTLILYKGDKEVARSIGDTEVDEVKALLGKAK